VAAASAAAVKLRLFMLSPDCYGESELDIFK
jgi:hypothetical protein